MATFTKFNSFVEYLSEKVMNLESDTLKVMFTDTAPVAGNTVYANLVDLSTANGYTATGTAATVSSSSQTSGTYKLVLADVTFTASGGSIGPFRYVVLYDDTPTSPADPLIGFWDYGAEVTVTNGNSFTVDFSAANGVLQIA